MSERLEIARELLSDDGVIFISIDDNEQAQLKLLCDEVFGEENFIATLSVENNPKGRKNSSFISGTNEYCQIYSKSKVNSEFVENIPKDSKDMSIDENGDYVHNSGKRVIVGENKFNKFVINFDSDKHYSVYYNELKKDFLIKKENLLIPDYDLLNNGYTRYYSHWDNKFVENTYTSEKLKNLFLDGKLEFKNSKIYEKNMSDKIRMKSLLVNRRYKAIIDNKEVDFEIDLKTTSAKQMLVKIIGNEIFSYPKNISYIKLLISLIEKKYSTILDFFAGSGTTGHAVMQLNKEDGGNRNYILCTNNENNICEEVTYRRLKNIQDELPHNLKYFKTDFISKYESDEDEDTISEKMLEYIKELIELEHHIEIDYEKYIILDDEDELEKTIENIKEGGKLFITSGIFLSRTHQRILDDKNVTLVDIPEYYYRSELKEVGEL